MQTIPVYDVTTEQKMAAMAAKLAERDPLTARMLDLRARTGRNLGVAVEQGRFRGYEGLGKDCRPVTGWFNTRDAAITALEHL